MVVGKQEVIEIVLVDRCANVLFSLLWWYLLKIIYAYL